MIRFSQDKLNKKDNRIDNAHFVAEMMKSEGWKLIEKRLSELRDEAKYHVLSVDVDSHKWRARLHAFDEALGIAEEYLLIGKAAKSEEV